MIADDPKKLEQLKNHFHDPDFDDWLEEFKEEQEKKSLQDDKSGKLSMPDEDTIKWSNENRRSLPTENYDVSEDVELSDWEEVR